MTPTIEDRHALGLRVGTVIRVDPHLGAGDPPFRLWIDFGPPGTHQSSAKITDRCSARDLIGRQVVAVTGFDPIRVGGFRSMC